MSRSVTFVQYAILTNLEISLTLNAVCLFCRSIHHNVRYCHPSPFSISFQNGYRFILNRVPVVKENEFENNIKIFITIEILEIV